MAKQRQNRTGEISDSGAATASRAHTRSRRTVAIAASTALVVGALAISAEAIAGDSAAAPTHQSTRGYLIPEAWGALIPPADVTMDLPGGVLNPEAYGALTPSLLPGAPEMSPEFLRALGLDG